LATGPQDEQRLALFIDYENIAIGVRDAHYPKFDINLVLERLLEKGKVLVKRAYADWSRYGDARRSFHEAALELIEVPQKSVGGKNSADIRLVVDAMDMSLQKEHINCFVIASGDSDFSPLVSKLKENNKYVIGLGVKNSTSDLLMENCDEFIFYEDLVRGQQRQLPQIANVSDKLRECFELLVDSVQALQRENKEVLWGSMVKETMKRKKPSFNETYYGFRSFSHLLEDAQRRGIVSLRRDQKSGSYIVEDLGPASGSTLAASAASAGPSRPEPAAAAAAPSPPSAPPRAAEPPVAAAPPAAAEANGTHGARRRRSRGRGRPRPASVLAAGAYLEPGSATANGDEAHEAAASDVHEAAEAEEPSDEPSAVATSAPPAPPEAPPASAGEAAAAPEPVAAPGPQPADRGFSLFSWIRRDTPPAAPPRASDEEDGVE
jgi:uncharacterized LabA/DUF88 family protein